MCYKSLSKCFNLVCFKCLALCQSFLRPWPSDLSFRSVLSEYHLYPATIIKIKNNQWRYQSWEFSETDIFKI